MNSENQFEIGGWYKNRNGWFEVIEINGDRLHIRCEKDGIEANLGMEIQKRIMANRTKGTQMGRIFEKL
jgi:hypothetical protein